MDIEKTMEFIVEHQAHFAAMLEQSKVQAEEHLAKHDRQIAQINEILRRAVRLAVQEARAERKTAPRGRCPPGHAHGPNRFRTIAE